MPLPPPVIMAVFPFNEIMVSFLLIHLRHRL
jgi:hypothetical protein